MITASVMKGLNEYLHLIIYHKRPMFPYVDLLTGFYVRVTILDKFTYYAVKPKPSKTNIQPKLLTKILAKCERFGL